MKPMLEAFAQAGVLTDEFGNALTDLSGFRFDDSIQSTLDGIRDVLLEIKDLLSTPVEPKLLTPMIQEYRQKKFGDRAPVLDEGTGTTGRVLQFPTEPATVTPQATFVFEMDGQMLARAQAPFVVGEAQRLGLFK
jgi:hypothetical protein